MVHVHKMVKVSDLTWRCVCGVEHSVSVADLIADDLIRNWDFYMEIRNRSWRRRFAR